MARIGDFPLWKWFPGRSWRIVANVEAADEIPIQLPPKGAVVVGPMRHPKWLAFDCPCKTGHRIMISLDPTHYPHWTIRDIKKLSVYPSVDYQAPERRCHYFITRGNIIWVKEKHFHERKR